MTASAPQWPALDSGYEDEFGPIDLEVYQAAGEIWLQAAVFGEFALQDRDEAFSLMLKAVARVSAVIASGTEIRRLKPYLLTTYKNLVAKEQARRLKREQPIPEFETELGEHLVAEIAADLDRKILLREAFRPTTAEDRNLASLVMLGHSFTEIGEELGVDPATLRQRWNRLMMRIRKKVASREHAETE